MRSGAPALDGPADVLALQRTAGNAAVARLLRARREPRRPVRRLDRFAGPEHEALGNAIKTRIDLGNGIVLTWGQVIAIAGDEYGTVDQLLNDARDPARRFELRAALEHADVVGAIPSALPAPTADQKSAHELAYYTLAFDNADHFPDSGRALGAWGRYHARSLSSAAKAGVANDPSAINTAYAEEAFGQHFLTDCYSGGHVRTPRAQIIDWYLNTWAPRAVPALLDSIQREMIDRLTAEADPQTRLPVRGTVTDRVHEAVAALTAKLGGPAALQRWLALGIAGAISGTIHDAEGVAGVVVSSTDHPVPWIAYGDNRLSSSPISREEAIKAIIAAKAQVDRAYEIGEQEGAAAGAQDAPARSENRALMRIHQELEPSIRAVERFIPRPVEERPGGPAGTDPLPKTANTPLPDWKWGNLSDSFADAINAYVKAAVGTKLYDAVHKTPELHPIVNDAWWHARITVNPREAVENIVNRLMISPLEELSQMIGWAARKPAPAPPQPPPSPSAPPDPPPDENVPHDAGVPSPAGVP